MSRLARLGRRLLATLRRRRGEAELDEEIGFHIAMETEENLRRGHSMEEARRRAERAFGRLGRTKHEVHEARRLSWLEDAAADIRLALRSIRRAPAFAAAVILLMALGIGANAAVYTVVDGVLLRPLPYPRADELYDLERYNERGAGTAHDGPAVTELRRWNDRDLVVAAVGGRGGQNLIDRELAFHVDALPVSHEYFDVMGVRLERGRRFEPADEHAGAAPVVILAHELARRLGDDALGRSVSLGGKPHRVIGVLPRDFRMLPNAEVLVPFRMGFEARGTNYGILARARGGPAVAEQRLAAATAELRRAGALRDVDGLRWIELHRSMSDFRRETILLLFAAVGLVLLIACANVAGLLLIKAQRRGAELAVRAALGAGPGRLVRQLLTEGLVHALAGGLVGVAMADWALALLLRLAPPDLADWSLGLDGRVVLFSLGLTLVTGLACGLFPALRASRVDLRHAVGSGATGLASSSPRGRWRRGLLVGQLALCTMLLLGAGLLVRTLLALRAVDPGFKPGSVLALTMQPDTRPEALPAFYAQALEQARAVPGIRRISLAGAVPGRRGLNLAMHVPGSDRLEAVGWRYVSPGYFEMLGIPLQGGRALHERDSAAAEPVVVINQALARRYFPDGDAIGRQIRTLADAPEREDSPRTIVGIVGDTRDEGPRRDAEPRMYVPVAQVRPAMFSLLHRWFDSCWLIDTDLAPALVSDRLGEVLHRLGPGVPFSEVTRLDEVVESQVAAERFLAWLLGAFAIAALGIAATGIYGLTAHAVSHRSREFAIRMALGASPARILRGVVGEGLVVAAAGIALGLAAAWPLGPLLQRFLYGAVSFDPATASTVALVLLAASLLASLAPAARAARIDPVTNLRGG